MEFLVFIGVLAVAAAGVLWGRRTFRHEIDRAKRIRRANRHGR